MDSFPEFQNTEPKENPSAVLQDALDDTLDSLYDEARMIKAMEIANSIPGIEYDTPEHWFQTVDQVITKIKQA